MQWTTPRKRLGCASSRHWRFTSYGSARWPRWPFCRRPSRRRAEAGIPMSRRLLSCPTLHLDSRRRSHRRLSGTGLGEEAYGHADGRVGDPRRIGVRTPGSQTHAEQQVADPRRSCQVVPWSRDFAARSTGGFRVARPLGKRPSAIHDSTSRDLPLGRSKQATSEAPSRWTVLDLS